MLRMKLWLFVSTLAFFGMTQAAMASDITIRVSGMVCAFCATGIEKHFKSEASVETVNVDLDKMLVELKTKPEAELSDDRITSLITSAGYKVTAIERN